MLRFTKLGIVLGWLIALLSAAEALAAAPSMPEPIYVSANGGVTDPAGKPVAGARVVIREWSNARYSENVYYDSSDVLAETTSDADGNFRFERVKAEPFERHEQHAAPWDVVAFAAGFGPAWVHLPKAQSDKPLHLQLHASRKIEGRLTDHDGVPVADCRVKVVSFSKPTPNPNYDYSDPARLDLWRSEIAPTSTTDTDGQFAFADLPVDMLITLSGEHPQFARAIVAVQTTDEPPTASSSPEGSASRGGPKPPPTYASGFTHSLAPGGQIRGQVLQGDTKRPIPAAKVALTWQSTGHFTKTDGDGQFKLVSLPYSNYNLSSTPEQTGYLGAFLQIELAEDNREQQVVLEYIPGELVHGKVIDADSGAGVAKVKVAYVPPDAPENSNWSPARSVESDDQGEFEIVVPAGRGKVRVGGGIEGHPTHDVPDFWRWRSNDHVADDCSVEIDVESGKPIEDVRLKVTRGLIVRGQVFDAVGKAIALAKVEAVDRFARNGTAKTTHTDEAGRFELAGFRPHQELQFRLTDSVNRLRGSAEIPAAPSAGPTRIVDLGPIKLRSTATVSGSVIAEGKPLAGANVHLNVFGKRDGEFIASRQDAVVSTDDEGKYAIDDVTTGEDFSLWVECRGYTDRGTKTYKLSGGESLEVPPVELKSRSASVGGIVVDLDGKPVANVTVSAWERDGYAGIAYGPAGPPLPTGADGRFLLTDLPSVPLKLMAYIQPPAESRERSIRFPAKVLAEPGQMDIRITLDPKLQRPLP